MPQIAGRRVNLKKIVLGDIPPIPLNLVTKLDVTYYLQTLNLDPPHHLKYRPLVMLVTDWLPAF